MAVFSTYIFISILMPSIIVCNLNDTESSETFLGEITSENPCSDVHSCNVEHKICGCDPECSKYGDCCFDSKKNESKVTSFSDYTCYCLAPLDGIFLKSRCKPGWTNQVVRRQCEEKVPADKSWFVPVTNANRTMSYRNKYCALCNEDDDVIEWELLVECPTLDDPNDASGLIYDGASNRWGVWIQRNGRSDFHACHLRSSLPSDISKSNFRECIPNVKHQCSSDWDKETIREKCRAYYSPINIGGKLYGNVHCAVCNREEKIDSKCMGSHSQRNMSLPGFYRIYDETDDLKEEQAVKCKSGQMYDPSLRKCRGLDVVCKMMKLEYHDGRCVSP